MAEDNVQLPRVATWTVGSTIELDRIPNNRYTFQEKIVAATSNPIQRSSIFPRMSSWNGNNSSNDVNGTKITGNRGSSFTNTLSSIMPPIKTNKSLWKQPELHHEISRSSAGSIIPHLLDEIESIQKAKPHRSENWHELFYDLIFVAASLQIGAILKAEISSKNIIQTSILFLILRSTWDNLMMYQNRFDTPDILHYFFYLLHSMAAFIMTLHLSIGPDDHNWDASLNISPFSFAAAVARFTTVIMYLHVFYHTDTFRTGFRNYLRLLTISQFISGCIFILIACLNQRTGYKPVYELLWVMNFFIERTFVSVVTTILQRRMNKPGRIAQHFEHMVQRQSVFILLISGEAIIQLVQGLTTYSAVDYVRGCLGFTIVYGVGICYYEQQQVCLAHPSVVKDTIAGYVWETMHILLSLSILFFAVGVKVVYSHSSEESGHDRILTDELFMTTSAAISLFMITCLRVMHKGLYLGVAYYRVLGTTTRSLAYAVRFIITFLISLIPLATNSSTATIVILCVLVLMMVFLDTIALSKRVDPSRAEEMGLVISHYRNRNDSSISSSYHDDKDEERNQRILDLNQQRYEHSQSHPKTGGSQDHRHSNDDSGSFDDSFDFDPDRIVSARFSSHDRPSTSASHIKSLKTPLIVPSDNHI